jgi:hypothetical protein
MRIRKAFLSGAVVAVAGLLAATAVMASDVPTSCVQDGVTITMTSGPVSVSDPSCTSGSCVTYSWEADAPNQIDKLFMTVPPTITKVGIESGAQGSDIIPAGTGDSKFSEMGQNEWHEAVVRLNGNSTKMRFTAFLEGTSEYALGQQSFWVRRGSNSVSNFACAGPVVIGKAQLATTTLTRTEQWNNCQYTATNLGGHRWHVELDPSSIYCTLEGPFDSITMNINGSEEAPVVFTAGGDEEGSIISIVQVGSCYKWMQITASSGPWYKLSCSPGTAGCVCK